MSKKKATKSKDVTDDGTITSSISGVKQESVTPAAQPSEPIAEVTQITASVSVDSSSEPPIEAAKAAVEVTQIAAPEEDIAVATEPAPVAPVTEGATDVESVASAESVVSSRRLFVPRNAKVYVKRVFAQMLGREISDAEMAAAVDTLERGESLTIRNDEQLVDVSAKLRKGYGYGRATNKA